MKKDRLAKLGKGYFRLLDSHPTGEDQAISAEELAGYSVG
jgi:hypothetical protein